SSSWRPFREICEPAITHVFAERRPFLQVHFILVARTCSNSANHAHQRDRTHGVYHINERQASTCIATSQVGQIKTGSKNVQNYKRWHFQSCEINRGFKRGIGNGSSLAR